LRIVVPRLNECFAGRHVLFGMEYSFPRIGRRALTVSYSPIEVSGSVEAVACVLRDVTDMKRIETVETGWQKRIELAEGAGLRIGLWDWDIQENTVVWSDESYRQWGFTRDTFSGNVTEAVPRIHPDDRPQVEAAIHRVISCETNEYSSQYRVQRPDGSVCWIDARGAILHSSSTRMIGIGVDITDYKRTHDVTNAPLR
ncbi:MAG: PAS domain-containing protein, partial [Acidobacteriaceae bacterium]